MTKNPIIANYEVVFGVILIVLNVAIIGPGSWFLSTIWDEANTFKTQTREQLDTLKGEINKIKVGVSSTYATKTEFSNYKEQMAENIRYLDSKVAGKKE